MGNYHAAPKHRQRRRASPPCAACAPFSLDLWPVMTTQELVAERRANDSAVLVLIQTIQSDVTDMKHDLNEHINTEPKEWGQVLSNLLTQAFPDGDPDGHRRDHEIRMKLAEEKAAFWAKMAYEIKKWGLIGFLLWAAKTLVEAGALWVQQGGHFK